MLFSLYVTNYQMAKFARNFLLPILTLILMIVTFILDQKLIINKIYY